MAGGATKYRHLSRDSSAREALLRGLVTQLVQHEHIQTTYAKAKEAQRMAEKLITLAKRDNEPARRSAQGILYTPDKHLPKLFGELRTRYLDREGGYTRVLRTEPKDAYDQAESAILEFVDGPKDSRFMLTAKAVARDRLRARPHNTLTAQNMAKVTRFRGRDEFDKMVQRFMALETAVGDAAPPEPESAEAVQMAEEERAAAQRMASRIVPGSAKTGPAKTGQAPPGSWGGRVAAALSRGRRP